MTGLIQPLSVFGAELNSVRSPARYIGGEYGITVKPHADGDSYCNFGIAFPDLYEIAMSNLAVKIIYNGLNRISGVRCERVFAPDTDFEELLRKKNVPLYTLETGMPLYGLDVLAFSIGYELGITEVLAMLDCGRIPLVSDERKEGCPIVIAGGCGVTNPAPIADFFDAIMIGEAEGGLFALAEELKELKDRGASRQEMLSHIESKPFMWTKKSCLPDGEKTARRAVQAEFGIEPSVPSWLPIASVKPVQDHGVVEIMRGCPNGCRFCHAGIYYRPMRVKRTELIISETDSLVSDAGYREISLNSLSSADFPHVEQLLDTLNERYKGWNVSFQLPSLKVNSLSLGILEKLSTVRRSGLTFAVETPDELWQLSLNKEVYAQHLEEIIQEAKSRGWSTAKLYFMIGLPLGSCLQEDTDSAPAGSEGSEEKAIADFLLELQSRTRIQCNVNVGIFIPKPHTAYQWARQISPERAKEKIEWIRQQLPRGKFRLGRHNYDATVLEGLISRGNRDAGAVILDAYRRGARLDAWDEHLELNREYWSKAFENAGWDVNGWIFRSWNLDEPLPWDGVSLGPSKQFFKKEWQKSVSHTLTDRCSSSCTHKCGVCGTGAAGNIVCRSECKETVSDCMKNKTFFQPEIHPQSNIPVLYRVLFSFSKKDGGEFIPYLSQVDLFRRALLRSRLPAVFTSGFNPLPRLEFATAIALGIPSREEIASCCLYSSVDAAEFTETLNSLLPAGFTVTESLVFPVTTLRKREPLSQGLWGCTYSCRFFSDCDAELFMNSLQMKSIQDSIPQISVHGGGSGEFSISLPCSDKLFRQAAESFSGKKWFELMSLEKTATLAKPEICGWTAADEENWRKDSRNFIKSQDTVPLSSSPVSFMELYRAIAQINRELIQKKEQLDMERKLHAGETASQPAENILDENGQSH